MAQILHAFDHQGHNHGHDQHIGHHHHDCSHSHSVSYPLDSDDHVQFKEVCTSCELLFNTSGLLQNISYSMFIRIESPEHIYSYSFQKEDQPLSYSLRGPPTS